METEFVKGLSIVAAGQLTKDYDQLVQTIEEIPLTKASCIRLIALNRALEDKVKKCKEYLTTRTANTGSYVDRDFGISLVVRDKARTNVDTDETRDMADKAKKEVDNVKAAWKVCDNDKTLKTKIKNRIEYETGLLEEGEELDTDQIVHEEKVNFLRDTFPGLNFNITEYREWTVKSLPHKV